MAQLCTLRLLHALRGAWPPPAALRCLAFGAPAVGNAALAEHVRRQAWGRYFTSVALPGRWEMQASGAACIGKRRISFRL